MAKFNDIFKKGDEIKNMKDKFGWQIVHCIEDGSGFIAGKTYRRNIQNDAWIEMN